MDEMKYFFELYEKLPRGGPGDNISTRRAYLLMKDIPEKPYILDIGCGPGIQTMELAKIHNSKIIAIDNHQPFLDILENNARTDGLNNITTKNMSMMEMTFGDNTFDIIWSEGALYFMGMSNALKKCKELLKPGGYLAFTEAVYLSPDPPQVVKDFWDSEYPDIQNVQGNLDLIKAIGFEIIDHFTLLKHSWFDHFYGPMEGYIKELKQKYQDEQVALNIFKTSQSEIEFYREYSDHYGYEFFIVQNNE